MDRAVVTYQPVRAAAEHRFGVLLRDVAYACIGFIVSSVYVTVFFKHFRAPAGVLQHLHSFGMLHVVIAILIVM